jgi:hypothetical protein
MRDACASVTLFLVLFLGMGAALVRGAARPALSDEEVVAQARRVASGAHVDLYQHGISVDSAFVALIDNAYRQVETVTGVKFDTATLGSKVHVYVSDAVTASHVWKGYQHPSDPRPLIFLGPRVYLGAMRGTDATYVHELTHLFTWRYYSHTLREGLADHVALVVLPGAAVGPNPGRDEWPPAIPPEILEYLGTRRPPPGWATTDPVRRRAYYFASRRFVSYLVDMRGMETFMKLYASETPETAIKNLYGITREEAAQAALKRP